MLSELDNADNNAFPGGKLREICGTHPDLLCSVVQIALWMFEFKLIKSDS